MRRVINRDTALSWRNFERVFGAGVYGECGNFRK